MKIVVCGLGYVGLANAVMLAYRHEVAGVDLNQQRIHLINQGDAPFCDSDIADALRSGELNLRATDRLDAALDGAEYLIIATPTDYDPNTNYFNTDSVDSVIDQAARLGFTGTVVIKSTVPVGYSHQRVDAHSELTLLFSPEFLREGQALRDCLYPSRIVVSGPRLPAQKFAEVLIHATPDADANVLITSTTEAESIKLFSNTYLAMRVAFFNELDSFANEHSLNVEEIIRGVSLDPRIGSHYNNPSFGYGGYCLPKDTKQLLANYENVPQTLIRAIVESNATRLQYIADDIMRRDPGQVGVYRLAMKSNSDNFRQSAVSEVVRLLKGRGVKVQLFEPDLPVDHEWVELNTSDFEEFSAGSTLIMANRMYPELKPVAHKVYTRDVFGDN